MKKRGFFGKFKKEYNKREAVCVALAVALLLAVGAYAWFAANGLRYFFGVKSITQAYTLYLTDAKDNRPLELRTKIPPSMNSKQEVVFKVKSRVNDSDVANEILKYELEMNYTENMPVTFSLYKYDRENDEYNLLEEYSDITEERREQAYTDEGYDLGGVNVYNLGKYRQYKDTTVETDDGDYPSYFTMGPAGDQYKIVIEWDLDRVNDPGDLNEYNKETDLIYIVAREVSTSDTAEETDAEN